MAHTRSDQCHQGDGEIDLPNISACVPEYSLPGENLYDCITGSGYLTPSATTNPGGSVSDSKWGSEVMVTRKMTVSVVIGALLLSTLISIITGSIVYHVTISKMEDNDQRNQQTTSTTTTSTTTAASSNLTDFISLEITHLKNEVARLSTVWNKDHGSTYIRWGKPSCPGNNTELVYSGYAGGSGFEYTGAASSYLCLPKDPQWGKYDDTEQDYGMVYGTEYQFHERKWFPNAEINNDVPCAVCRSPRASVLMIPGRNTCYGNWIMEYHGYLASGHYDHPASSDFVCVDENPESVIGGHPNDNGKLLYLVEGRCGSLPCPPYFPGRELTCVVCSN